MRHGNPSRVLCSWDLLSRDATLAPATQCSGRGVCDKAPGIRPKHAWSHTELSSERMSSRALDMHVQWRDSASQAQVCRRLNAVYHAGATWTGRQLGAQRRRLPRAPRAPSSPTLAHSLTTRTRGPPRRRRSRSGGWTPCEPRRALLGRLPPSSKCRWDHMHMLMRRSMVRGCLDRLRHNSTA